jgi:hypothetical protein
MGETDRAGGTGRTAALLATGVLVLAACADDSANGLDVSEQDDVQWLYVIDADAAVTTDSSLTLTALDQDAVAFSDRPVRQARRLPVQELVSGWSAMGFVDDPPNAALAVTREGKQQTYVVELTEPQLDTDQLTFSYVRIDEPGEPLPAELSSLAVFIDDAHDGPPVISPGTLDGGDGTVTTKPPATTPERSQPDEEGGAPTP